MRVSWLWRHRWRLLRWSVFAVALIGLSWALHAWLPPQPRWTAEEKLSWATFSPDGSRVLTVPRSDHDGSFRGPVQVWDTATGRADMRFAKRVEQVLAFETSADFRRWVAVVTLQGDPAPRLWVADLETGHERDCVIALMNEEIAKDVVQISLRGDVVAIRTMPPVNEFTKDRDAYVVMLDAETGKRIARLPVIGPLARFTPKGDLFVFGQSDDQGAHVRIGRWNPSTRQTVWTEKYRDPLFELSPDGQTICVQEVEHVAEKQQSRVLVWDLSRGRRRVLFEGTGERFTRYSPNGALLALGGVPPEADMPIEAGETIMALYDVMSGKKYGEVSCHGDARVSFPPDGARVLIFDDQAGGTRCRTIDVNTFAVLWERAFPDFRDPYPDFSDDGDVVSLTNKRGSQVVLLDGRIGATRAVVPSGTAPPDLELRLAGVRQHGSYLRVSSSVLPKGLLGGDAIVVPVKGFFGQWLDKLLPSRGMEFGHMETIIELRTGRVVYHSIEYGSISTVLSPGGQTLLVSDECGEIRCYDVPARKPLRWVLGVPVAIGLGLVALRAVWRKLRAKKAKQKA